MPSQEHIRQIASNPDIGQRVAMLEVKADHVDEALDDLRGLIHHNNQSLDNIASEIGQVNKNLSKINGIIVGAGVVVSLVWAVVIAVWDKVVK
jgi:hypothetical protein